MEWLKKYSDNSKQGNKGKKKKHKMIGKVENKNMMVDLNPYNNNYVLAVPN